MSSLSSRACAATLALLLVLPLLASTSALAATPSEGTVTPASPTVAWSGGLGLVADPLLTGCTDGDPSCDVFQLTVDLGDSTTRQDLMIGITSATAVDYDLWVYDADWSTVASGTSSGSTENVTIERIGAGLYYVAVKAWAATAADSYDANATLVDTGVIIGGGDAPTAGSDDIRWAYDTDAPQLSVEVPLRVVMVGFDPEDPRDAFTAQEIFREIPDHQRVGSLYSYGGGSRFADESDLFGLDTLVNHGRAYYRSEEPFLLPIEYRWQPELIYAPDAFADGLFAAMMDESFLADPAGPTQAQFIEQYNATRGSALRVAASGDIAQAVAPGSQQRMIDAEAIEDWLAQNTGSHLDFEATNDIANVGYTVYFLNTWDSPQALTHFPAGEYHNWYIERIDPDTGEFDGIDWARIWGGRYRFMMVDLGAAPNAYEDQTWAGGDPSTGSTAYDPPLWEYRAEAPRPITTVHLADGIEQALTPGASWDRDQLAYMMARTTNQAVNFRFFHSYLYEPRPGTGRFWLSDNVWHDEGAEIPWASDLTKLYDQDVALTGLRSLTPYFEFDGDVQYQYLADPPAGQEANYAADQAALDQAKQDGDDIAGVPHVSMHTLTMMDYLDAHPERFHRGGGCFTTVPTISVVVPLHYAWALPVAAGIATNRDGVPWGFLQSVNDATKWEGSGREDTTQLYHVNPRFSGTFTYTVVHEASHYLGLAHPHDTIGAIRGDDGEPVYYDGFAWTFNSTAAPTTYSHVELLYGILDQESIARGHASYYLTWVDEALTQAGDTFHAEGVTTVSALPGDLQALRATAIDRSVQAEKLFAAFDFVGAAFAAQEGWEAAASFRDAALGLEPGTSQLEKNTALGLDADVADCVEPAGSTTPIEHDHDDSQGHPLPATGGPSLLAFLGLALGLFGLTTRRRRDRAA